MIKEAISKLIESKNLTREEAYQSMNDIMTGQATASQIAGFLVALRNKGETVPEIAGCALAMRDAAVFPVIKAKNVIDSCGTGGDGRHSLNISTAAAFVVAGAGWTIAKHGNRAVSSQSGSADVLEALGVKVDVPAMVVERCLDEAGIGFLFAPQFHPAMKHAAPTRRELGIRTVFNILGPLTNPARADVQLIGVFSSAMAKTLAQVMKEMGHKAGLVVHSGGWDEITLHAPTLAVELFKGKLKTHRWTNVSFGLPIVAARHLNGGDAKQNAASILAILKGDKRPVRSVIVANAAALIWIAARAHQDKTWTLKEAVKTAEQSIDSGAAWAKYEQMAALSAVIEK